MRSSGPEGEIVCSLARLLVLVPLFEIFAVLQLHCQSAVLLSNPSTTVPHIVLNNVRCRAIITLFEIVASVAWRRFLAVPVNNDFNSTFDKWENFGFFGTFRPSEDKLGMFREWPTPKTKEELLKFTYMLPFLRNYNVRGGTR